MISKQLDDSVTERLTHERRARDKAVRNAQPGGHAHQTRAAVACSIVKGVHRWAEPFGDGDTCTCGALHLFRQHGAAIFEVHDV